MLVKNNPGTWELSRVSWTGTVQRRDFLQHSEVIHFLEGCNFPPECLNFPLGFIKIIWDVVTSFIYFFKVSLYWGLQFVTSWSMIKSWKCVGCSKSQNSPCRFTLRMNVQHAKKRKEGRVTQLYKKKKLESSLSWSQYWVILIDYEHIGERYVAW